MSAEVLRDRIAFADNTTVIGDSTRIAFAARVLLADEATFQSDLREMYTIGTFPAVQI